MIGLEAWFAGGERVPVTLPDRQVVHLFCRVSGAGPSVTLLHGFPTCSWDWAEIADSLTPAYRLLLPDLLGFGDSDKPPGHSYSLVEQADVIEALWRHYDVQETGLVAHDIGGTVAQELLARQSEGRLAVRLKQVVLLNGALYHAAARPRPAQRLLAQPVLGPILSRLITERLFSRNLAAVFSTAHPLPPEMAGQYWAAFRRRSTSPLMHRLLQYIPERQHHHVRWQAALERSAAPLSFVWGMDDPVSGPAVADIIRQRVPRAEFLALDNVGHYPQLEVPERIRAVLAAALHAPA